MLGNVQDVCSDDQSDNFTCPQGRVNYNSAVLWGGMASVAPLGLHKDLTDDATAIGPTRLYNIGKIYSGLLHFFWIGALLPIITFALRKKFPKSRFLDAIHWPIFFAGTGNLPPAVRIPPFVKGDYPC